MKNRKWRYLRNTGPFPAFQSDLQTMSNGPQTFRQPGQSGAAIAMANTSRVPGNTAKVNSGAGLSSDTTGQLAAALTKMVTQNSGVVDFSTDTMTIAAPKSTSWTVTSTFNTSAVTKTVTAFNQNVNVNGLPASPTTNGSGANSITYTYNDYVGGSTTGQLISAISTGFNKGHGMWCYGFSIQYTTAGVSNSAAILNANTTMIYYNGDGTSNPMYINIQDALRNTQYISGLLTVVRGFNVPSYSQFNVNIPAGDGATDNAVTTLAMVFFWRPLM
jgi:hypothetical protein